MTAAHLLLLRHATTGAGVPGHPDADRELTAHGRREAAAVGAHLRSTALGVDAVLCSPARRTRHTLELLGLEQAAPTGPSVEVAPWLYRADPDELVARLVDHAQGTLLVVGHAPAVPGAAAALAGPASEDGALARLRQGFPPATLAHLVRTAAGVWRLVAVRLPDVEGGEQAG